MMGLWRITGRTLYWLARLVWWPLRLTTRRARLALIVDGEILLVRNWFGNGRWTLPGGGLHKGESVEEALQRELKEELDITIDKRSIHRIGTIQVTEDNLRYSIILARSGLAKKPELQMSKELTDASWFRIDRLPQERAPIVDDLIK